MTEKLFQLTFNEKQGQVIEDALDLYMRIQAGQLHPGTFHCIHTVMPDDHAAVDEALQTLKQQWFPELYLGASDFGKGHAFVADDVRMVIREGLSWSRNPDGPSGGFWTVNFDKPLFRSGEPPALMTAIVGGEAQRIRKKVEGVTIVPQLETLLGTRELVPAVERVLELLEAEKELQTLRRECDGCC